MSETDYDIDINMNYLNQDRNDDHMATFYSSTDTSTYRSNLFVFQHNPNYTASTSINITANAKLIH